MACLCANIAVLFTLWQIEKQKSEAGPRGFSPSGLGGISAQSHLGGGMGMGGGFGESNNGSAFGSIASSYGSGLPEEKGEPEGSTSCSVFG
jgi:hypothetical protein